MAPFHFLAGLAALIPFTMPGFAPHPGTDQIPSSTLMLTTTTTDDRPARTIRLTCEPSGGDHPKAAQACDELLRAGGEVSAVEDTDGSCTLEYRPVHVTAHGDWRGEPRSFESTYPNECTVRHDTGPVFDF